MVTTPVSMPLATTGPVSAATIAKVTQRLLPFLLLMYVLAFLDRANVGFAKKAFQLDTGISDAAYRLRRRRVLRGLCAARGPEQPDHAQGRRPRSGCAGSW